MRARGNAGRLHNQSGMAAAPKLTLTQLRHLPIAPQAHLALHQIPKNTSRLFEGLQPLDKGPLGGYGG